MVAGAALMLLPYGVGLNMAGFFLLAIGILFIFVYKSAYKLEGTTELYRRKELYFKHEEMERIKKALSSQTPQLDMSEEGKGKSLKLDIFYSQKSGKGFVRLYEYVPYTYEPLTDNKEFRIGQIEQLIK
jgi:hypothetical protein